METKFNFKSQIATTRVPFWYNNGLEKKYHPIIEYGFVNYVTECGMELFDFDCGYEVWGSMIVVIEWLIKEGYFPNEYLKKM